MNHEGLRGIVFGRAEGHGDESLLYVDCCPFC